MLALKGLAVDSVSHHLRKGEQRAPDYLARNPQGLVPALELDDGQILTQSLAICEYLDELFPDPPLLPRGPAPRAYVRALAQIVACDIHPVQNLKVLARLRAAGLDEAAVQAWARTAIEEGVAAYERRLEQTAGRFSYGDQLTLADVCLVPQLGNARRFGVRLDCPLILSVEANCRELPAFAAAAPEAQPDAE